LINFLEELSRDYVFRDFPDSTDRLSTTFELRTWCCKFISYAIPNEEALNKILKLSPIIEIGSGRGYWGRLLEDMGCEIICVDNRSHFGRWFYVKKQDMINKSFEAYRQEKNKTTPNGFENIEIKKYYKEPLFKNYKTYLRREPNRNLFLCWPPYEEPLAYTSLKKFKGKYVIYVGEGYGGCTGCNRFHNLLEKEFDLEETVDIPQWFGIHDSMYIYKRKIEDKPL